MIFVPTAAQHPCTQKGAPACEPLEMNFLTLGSTKAIPLMLLFASFYQPLKKPLAVDERLFFQA